MLFHAVISWVFLLVGEARASVSFGYAYFSTNYDVSCLYTATQSPAVGFFWSPVSSGQGIVMVSTAGEPVKAIGSYRDSTYRILSMAPLLSETVGVGYLTTAVDIGLLIFSSAVDTSFSGTYAFTQAGGKLTKVIAGSISNSFYVLQESSTVTSTINIIALTRSTNSLTTKWSLQITGLATTSRSKAAFGVIGDKIYIAVTSSSNACNVYVVQDITIAGVLDSTTPIGSTCVGLEVDAKNSRIHIAYGQSTQSIVQYDISMNPIAGSTYSFDSSDTLVDIAVDQSNGIPHALTLNSSHYSISSLWSGLSYQFTEFPSANSSYSRITINSNSSRIYLQGRAAGLFDKVFSNSNQVGVVVQFNISNPVIYSSSSIAASSTRSSSRALTSSTGISSRLLSTLSSATSWRAVSSTASSSTSSVISLRSSILTTASSQVLSSVGYSSPVISSVALSSSVAGSSSRTSIDSSGVFSTPSNSIQASISPTLEPTSTFYSSSYPAIPVATNIYELNSTLQISESIIVANATLAHLNTSTHFGGNSSFVSTYFDASTVAVSSKSSSELSSESSFDPASEMFETTTAIQSITSREKTSILDQISNFTKLSFTALAAIVTVVVVFCLVGVMVIYALCTPRRKNKPTTLKRAKYYGTNGGQSQNALAVSSNGEIANAPEYAAQGIQNGSVPPDNTNEEHNYEQSDIAVQIPIQAAPEQELEPELPTPLPRSANKNATIGKVKTGTIKNGTMKSIPFPVASVRNETPLPRNPNVTVEEEYGVTEKFDVDVTIEVPFDQ